VRAREETLMEVGETRRETGEDANDSPPDIRMKMPRLTGAVFPELPKLNTMAGGGKRRVFDQEHALSLLMLEKETRSDPFRLERGSALNLEYNRFLHRLVNEEKRVLHPDVFLINVRDLRRRGGRSSGSSRGSSKTRLGRSTSNMSGSSVHSGSGNNMRSSSNITTDTATTPSIFDSMNYLEEEEKKLRQKEIDSGGTKERSEGAGVPGADNDSIGVDGEEDDSGAESGGDYDGHYSGDDSDGHDDDNFEATF